MTTRLRAGVAVCVGVSLALLVASAPADAAKKRITGKLSKPGYTVIALAANGKAKAVRTKPRKFKLRPSAKRVTLHLRAKDGTYAGPIVVARKKKGKRAILGVKAGAKLGKVKIKARKGYAKVKRQLPKRFVDSKRQARAKKGAPIGAGKFGRVRSKHTKGGAPGDRDLDGVPEPLDIDDDGDLILDNSDRSSAARAAQAPPPPPPFSCCLSTLSLGLGQTANANPRDLTDSNRPAFTDAQIDAALKSSGGLIFGVAPGGGSSELDCAGDPGANPPRPGLIYCSRGGTGRAFVPGLPPPPPGVPRPDAPFPGDPGGPFDPDRDGFGTLARFMGGPQLLHGATSAEIKTGDVLIGRTNDASGVETGAFTETLQYVFATVPALASYRDTTMAAPATLSYPYPPGIAHHLPVSAPPGQDVVVTLTFWRPQRRRIAEDPAPQPGESVTWTDIGGGVGYGGTAGAGGPNSCPQSAFSEDDPNLTDPPPGPPGLSGPIAGTGGFTDQAPDRPANPNETLTFTLNLTQCLRSKGEESSFDESGEVLLFTLLATGRGGRADQSVNFERQ